MFVEMGYRDEALLDAMIAVGGLTDFAWVFSLFLLTQTATIPIYGKLADLYGRRPVFTRESTRPDCGLTTTTESR